ncbi:MAG: hypothetical protein IPJ30_10955 [Acidobacteria bacterium]|nr:hypothetical protein [Acidobacteriota bacterium]
MPAINISIDHSMRLIRLTASGVFYREDGETMISDARRLAAEHDYDLFYDVRDAISKVDFKDWFQLPKRLSLVKDNATKNPRVALLISASKDESTGYVFYEFVAQNAGLNVRSFANEREAFVWLTSDRDASNEALS